MASSATFPATINGSIYPSVPNTQFPETAFPEFNPAKKYVGIALSGGGPRAMSCAMGQMRALLSHPLYKYTGAISCVSGGSWFGTPFSFAPESFSDATLLGTQIPPSQLTLQALQQLDLYNICFPLTAMTDSFIALVLGSLYEIEKVPYNKLWSRMLNYFFLNPLKIDDAQTFFTLNNTTLQKLLSQNVSLTRSNFYLLRNNRPFYIAGGTQNYPLGINQVMRHMEYTAMYAGTPQQCGQVGPNKEHYGYGYVDNVLFDTLKPQPTSATTANAYLNTNPANSKQEPFLLCDQMGSTSSAPGSDLDFFNAPGWFPQFNYWSPAYTGKESTEFYSFTDGGNLENTGIIPLLRRQYSTIIACVNSELPLTDIDSTTQDYVDGIDAQVARLFGRMPLSNGFPVPKTQVFNDNGKFDALNQALHTAKANGKPLIYQDLYTIYPNNYFGVPAYPNGKTVEVIWIYNDMNKEWYNELPASVQTLLKSTARDNYMLNFPNLNTVGQNQLKTLDVWIYQALYYTPQQINLLANMHYYNIWNGSSAQIFENVVKSLETEGV